MMRSAPAPKKAHDVSLHVQRGMLGELLPHVEGAVHGRVIVSGLHDDLEDFVLASTAVRTRR